MKAYNFDRPMRGCIDGSDIRYTLWPATVREGKIAAAVHLLAVAPDSVLLHGARGLRTGVSILLTVGAIDVAARVATSEGARARLDIGSDDYARLVALLDSAADAHVGPSGTAHNDAGPACRIDPVLLASDDVTRAARHGPADYRFRLVRAGRGRDQAVLQSAGGPA